MKIWFCALFSISRWFGDALVLETMKQQLQVRTDPSTLLRACKAEVDELEEAVTACEEAVERHTMRTEQAIAESSTQRRESGAEAEKLQKVIEDKEKELDEIEAENAELHKKLLAELSKLKRSSFAAVAVRQTPDMSQQTEQAWMDCEEEKTTMELKAAQCRARLTAEQSRQELRRGHHQELEANSRGNADMLKEQLVLLEEQIAQAKKRLLRRQTALRQVQQMTQGSSLSQLSLPEISNTSRNLLSLESAPNDGKAPSQRVEAAKKALKAAETARAEAAAKHQERLAKSRQHAEVAKHSSKFADSVRSELEEVHANISMQNDTFQRRREQTERAVAHATKAKAQAGILREAHLKASNASREAFMKAFLLDHERVQSKQAYEDAVVEARIASRRWEQEQHEENLAAFNLTRLAAEEQRLEWRLKKAASAEAEAATKAQAAQRHLEEAEAQLKAEERRVRTTEEALEAALHNRSSAVVYGGPWLSALLSVALASFIT